MINNFLTNSIFFGVLISLITYELGTILKNKTKLIIFNPLLVSMFLIIGILTFFKIPYSSYVLGSKYITYLLTPATICLAVPLYEKISLLKANFIAISLGILSGVFTSILVIFSLSLVFNLSNAEYVTLLPKSITTAIGIDLTKEFGGYPDITVTSIVITGVFGNVFAEKILKLFSITNPIAKGIGIGTSSHAMGTSKAIELGETEGAMSSLAIVVAGIFTVIFASFFINFI